MTYAPMKVPQIEVPKHLLTILNNIYEIEKKLSLHGDPGNALRNVNKVKESFEVVGLLYEDPQGQDFSQTRTDLEVSITGTGTENLIVVEVIKPIIRWVDKGGDAEISRIVQKGIVVVESKK